MKTDADAMQSVRPSSLPKLACCRAYVPAEGSSAAAERGTRMDRVIRDAWALQGDEAACSACLEQLGAEDAPAARWAIETMRGLAGDAELVTDEALLEAVTSLPGLRPGTMDGLCAERSFLIDFKTGQVRDYRLQMAAYALACMEAYFADSWTAHLLFVDQREVVSHDFTEAEAREEVERVIQAPVVPHPCDYCGWCAAFDRCPAVLGAVQQVQQVAASLPAASPAALSLAARDGVLPGGMAEMLADEGLAHRFLQALKLANDWGDKLKSLLRQRVADAGGKTEFFSLVMVSGRKVCYPLELGRVFSDAGWQNVLGIMSPVSADKANELHVKVYGKPLPESYVHTAAGSTQLRLVRKKSS